MFHSSPDQVEPGRGPPETISSIPRVYLEASIHQESRQSIGHLGSLTLSQMTSLLANAWCNLWRTLRTCQLK